MRVLKNKKILLILPVIVVLLIVLFLIPNSGSIYKEELNTSVDLNIENSEYRVVFNGNGNTSGTTESITCEYTVNCKLTSNGFLKTGYTFAGWATSANGEKVYNDGEEVLNLVLTGDYPLYAKWIANELTFNNQTITKTYNKTESQTANITEASNGTGAYTYTKKSEKDLDEIDTNYISISGSTITISADTQADTYTVVITATDNNSGASKDATYTITVEKATPTVSLTPKTGMVYTGSEQVANEATVTPETGGEVTYTYYTDNSCTVPYIPNRPVSSILTTAQSAGQLNQIPNTNIYIFKGGKTNPPANYVKFNCSDPSDTTTCEDWRIIGIYNGQMKIIRVGSNGQPIAPEGFKSVQWNTTYPTPKWANSSLKESLNTTYYNTLSDTAKAMIDENGSWDVGPSTYNAIASEAYTQATTSGTVVGSTTHTTPWTGKVGLMASYEYLYATGGGDTCLTKSGFDYDEGCGTVANDWLLNTSSNLWTISPLISDANFALFVNLIGRVNTGYANYYYNYAAAPAVFLKSSVRVASGDGRSPSSAYVLDESSVVNAGNYSVKASVSETENYNSAESSCVAHTIAKSDTTTSLSAITKTYTGSAQVATGAVSTLNSNNSTIENAEYTYTYYEGTSCDGIALASAPINAGEYRVKATLTGTDNYNSSTSSCTVYTMNRNTPTVSLTPKTGMVYTGSEQVANEATVTPETGGEVTYTYYTDNACTVPYIPTKPVSSILATAQNAGQLNQILDTNIYIFKGGTTNPPANYVKFNCSDPSDTTTCEDWRIIGIYNGQMKIIRVGSSGRPTAPSGFTSVEWNSGTPNPGWANSSLMTSLNTTYYNTLSDTAKGMIDENGSWNVGPAAYNATASGAYISATTSGTVVGSTTHTTPWVGKVGLMATYEFLYASNEEGCLNETGDNYSSSCGIQTNNWLQTGSWTVSPMINNANNNLFINQMGFVSRFGSVTYTVDAVPVVFLKSTIRIISGDGRSPSTAYILSESSLSPKVDAGNYSVKASVSATENYNGAESTCVAHTIAKSNTTTTLAAITNEYNGTSQVATGAVSTLNSNNSTIENAEYTYTYYEGTSCDGIALASAPINAGEYRVKATLTGTDNYNSSTSSCTVYTMEPAKVTVTINKGGAPWSNSGINVALYQNDAEVYGYSSATVNGATVTFNDVTAGTFDIYISQDENNLTTLIDSELDIEMPTNTNQTINFYQVTFDANTGAYSNSNTTNSVVYYIMNGAITKYSHTQNVDDTGLKSSDYGNSWTNANITGTDRGDTTQAHVVTIPGASSITVDLYYNGESTSYDWVSVWAGNYPSYIAASNYSSTGKVTTVMGAEDNNNKFGGNQSGSYTVNGNSLTSMGHTTLTIPGDTVTFGFRSDGSGYGQGYGYYAIVSGTGRTHVNYGGIYQEPTKDGRVFTEWNTERDGSGTTYKDESSIVNLENMTQTLYAQYRLPTATFKAGKEFNVAIKQASGQTDATYSTSNSTITAFTKYNGTPTQEILNNATIVSSDDSESNIYAWFDNGTIYWYSESDTIYFNANSSYMFNYLTGIDTIDLSEFDLSKATSVSSMFSNTTNMTTLITPKVNASSSISIGKTMLKSDNTTYSSITSTMTPMTTLKVPYTITFDKNGGVSSSCTSTSLTKKIYPGNPLGTIPSATFTKVGYTVDGYQTETNGGSVVTESTIPPSSITYYAKWIKDANAVFAEDIKNNETYANVNCESIQCIIEYFAQFKEKRRTINGN